MRWSFSIIGVMILCLFSMFILFFFEEVTISNEQDYYLLKEMTEAAMIDAVDIAYYRDTGEIKIIKEKFVENFTRRFVQNAKVNGYILAFYDIMEEPPKVTVKVVNSTEEYNIYTNMPGSNSSIDSTKINVVNENTGILSTEDCFMNKRFYSITYKAYWKINRINVMNYPAVEIKEMKGYIPIKATYIKSFTDEAKTESDIESLVMLYEKEKKLTYSGSTSQYDIASYNRNDYFKSFANIVMTSFGLVEISPGKYGIKYTGYSRCENQLASNVELENGVNYPNVCIEGKIYEILYQKDTDYCRNQASQILDENKETTPTEKTCHRKKIYTGTDIGYDDVGPNWNGVWTKYESYQNAGGIVINSPCTNSSKNKNCKLMKIYKSGNEIRIGSGDYIVLIDKKNKDNYTLEPSVVGVGEGVIETDSYGSNIQILSSGDINPINKNNPNDIFADSYDINLKVVKSDETKVVYKYYFKGVCQGKFTYIRKKDGKEIKACALGYSYAVGWEYDEIVDSNEFCE